MTDKDPLRQTWRDLNTQFYSGNPAAYFRSRWNLLVLAAGKPDELARLLAEGVEYDELIARIDLTDGDDPEGERLHLAFLVTESQVLLHHTSEALLRLFLGHSGSPPCPWVECATFLDFRAFRRVVAELAKATWPQSRRDDVSRVFLGCDPRADDPEWEAAATASERLVRLLAVRINQDASLYNSAKHGMTVIGSNAAVRIGVEGGEGGFGTEGPSIAFLESVSKDGQRVWRETTQWFSIRQALWLTSLAITQIDALWDVAKAVYLDAEVAGVELVTPAGIDMVTTGRFADTKPINRFSRNLFVVKGK